MAMRIDVVTLFPDEFRASVAYGVVGRAIADGAVALRCWNPRGFATDRRGTVDDRPFGGGPGMVMQGGPLFRCIVAARGGDRRPVRVAALTPQGRRFTDQAARELAGRERLLLVCGRYEGIDERVLRAHVDEEWSIGDYVLSGGEPAATVVVDAVVRLRPGVLGHDRSAVEDSFVDGLLDHPHFTRPEQCDEGDVPAVLRSGHHAAVAAWRERQRLLRTWRRRPDLLAARRLHERQRVALAQVIEAYMAGDDGAPDDEAR